MADFLFEIGLEEVPARMLASAQAELLKRTVAMLERERLVAGEVDASSYSTPRRLAVIVKNMQERQANLTEDLLGPAVKIAYKDGVPGPAAVAFAKKSGVAVEALRVVETPKGEYIAATSIKHGKHAAQVIAAELPKEIAGIYWAKNMYWRKGKPERFVRPVRWMVGLLGTEVVPVEFGGYTAGRETFGHRVLFGATPIELGEPAEYVESLRNGFVMADDEVRRHTIRKALDRVCRSVPGARWREDLALVEKMTNMTEWPSVILGSFDPAYLTLPEEVLVTVMRDHQNYFAVESADGKLAPHFLAVLNTVADEKGEAVIRHGNERVLRARFNDARFFWDFDQRTPLEDRVMLLEKVTFQKDLGSYAAKSERVQRLSGSLAAMVAKRGLHVDPGALHDASRLAKTDLTTELVKEFTELQGQVGGLYARAQGVSAKAAAAIYDQYLPASMEDSIPRTVEGQLLAIADKADSIAGMFSLGLEPTGSKDPFALRRAANGIVKILAESELKLTLGEIAFAAAPVNEPIVGKMELFFAERVEFYLREARSQAYDVVAAVLAVGANDVRDALARAEAVTAVRGSDDFAAVCAALKRTRNILAQAAEKGIEFGRDISGLALTTPAEHALVARTIEVQNIIAPLRRASDYVGALEAIATLRPEVDRFFDSVMVMDPDETIRRNRLTLLNWVQSGLAGIADFSEIVVAG
jgi:glycyl-tRNA synthetase beta chain